MNGLNGMSSAAGSKAGTPARSPADTLAADTVSGSSVVVLVLAIAFGSSGIVSLDIGLLELLVVALRGEVTLDALLIADFGMVVDVVEVRGFIVLVGGVLRAVVVEGRFAAVDEVEGDEREADAAVGVVARDKRRFSAEAPAVAVFVELEAVSPADLRALAAVEDVSDARGAGFVALLVDVFAAREVVELGRFEVLEVLNLEDAVVGFFVSSLLSLPAAVRDVVDALGPVLLDLSILECNANPSYRHAVSLGDSAIMLLFCCLLLPSIRHDAVKKHSGMETWNACHTGRSPERNREQPGVRSV